MERIMWSGVNQNIDGANLVKPNIGFFSLVKSRRIYWDSLHMIDGAKPEIEGVNQNIDGAKYQVV